MCGLNKKPSSFKHKVSLRLETSKQREEKAEERKEEKTKKGEEEEGVNE